MSAPPAVARVRELASWWERAEPWTVEPLTPKALEGIALSLRTLLAAYDAAVREQAAWKTEYQNALVLARVNGLNSIKLTAELERLGEENRRLYSEVRRLADDAKRMDWLEQNAGRVGGSRLSGPADDSPRFVIWGDTDETDALGDTLRETIDAARGAR